MQRQRNLAAHEAYKAHQREGRVKQVWSEPLGRWIKEPTEDQTGAHALLEQVFGKEESHA